MQTTYRHLTRVMCVRDGMQEYFSVHFYTSTTDSSDELPLPSPYIFCPSSPLLKCPHLVSQTNHKPY